MSFYRYKPASEKKVVSVNEAMQKMANYCAYQERCHSAVGFQRSVFLGKRLTVKG